MSDKITVIIPEDVQTSARVISKSIQGPRGPRGEPGLDGAIAAEVSKTFSYNLDGTIDTILKGTELFTYEYDSNGVLNSISSDFILKEFVYDSNNQLVEIIVNDL